MEWPTESYVEGSILHHCFPPTTGKQRRWQSRMSSRRLITLVFAGRNRMLVIRRELPRTDNADWARRACRTKDMRVLLFVSPSTATRSALVVGIESLCSNSIFLKLSFNLHSDSPDETQQLSSHGGDDLRLVLSSCKETLPAGSQGVVTEN
jgi:hypothetical protein